MIKASKQAAKYVKYSKHHRLNIHNVIQRVAEPD